MMNINISLSATGDNNDNSIQNRKTPHFYRLQVTYILIISEMSLALCSIFPAECQAS